MAGIDTERLATSIAARMALVAACVLAAACGGDPGPPRFLSLQIIEDVSQRRVDPQANGSYVLQRDTRYMARVTVEQSGGANRCLFEPFNANWTPPSRSFGCHPEVPAGVVTIEEPFATWSADIARVPEHNLTVQLYEMDAARRELIAIHEVHRYAVTFAGS
jgi:hypothetical protein